MKVLPTKTWQNNSLISLKSEDWLNKQRVAGRVAARTLLLLEMLVREKTTKTLLELDALAKDYILSQDCTPTFLGYKGFPNTVCISVNKQLVHGIPNDYKLKDGDMISFDLGATYHGVIADTAITCLYGEGPEEQRRIIRVGKDTLIKGIEAVKVGSHIGAIGYAMHRFAKGNEFSVIENYGGHGLELNKPHADPFVANKANQNEGVRIKEGLTIAIEPQITNGSIHTRVDSDGWTVWCDAELSVHEEHTIFVHKDRVEIITDRSRLSVP